MLPYFLRHYEQFCDSIVVYDNESDDGSQDIVSGHPLCDLRRISSGGQKENRILRYVKGQLWKESRGCADWVICCDVDELLYHPDLMEFLRECRERGVTLPIPTAWQMVHPQFPTGMRQIYDEVRTGYVDPLYSKWIIFDPNAIQEINYGMGCHHAKPDGNISFRNDPLLKLLHFKFLGLDWVIQRYAELAQRISNFDRQHEWGVHHLASAERLASDFEVALKRRIPVPLDIRESLLSVRGFLGVATALLQRRKAA